MVRAATVALAAAPGGMARGHSWLGDLAFDAGVLGFAVAAAARMALMATEPEEETGQVEPDEQDDHSAERAVGQVVVLKADLGTVVC